jgi:hypothetical protein
MYYNAFDFADSLFHSAELGVWFKHCAVYWRRGRKRKPAIWRYYYDTDSPETVGLFVENRKFSVQLVDKPLDGYVPVEAVLTNNRLRALMGRVKAAGMTAACQWVEEALQNGNLWAYVTRVRKASDIFPPIEEVF